MLLYIRRLLPVAALLSVEVCRAAAYSPVSAAVVIDAKNGKVICSHNADQKTQPASLTKMMTLLLVFRALQSGKISTSTMIRISTHAAAQRPSVLGLKSGEYISVANAILALIVKSANDVAVALAEHIGKSEALFVAMMNREARRLGMKSTIFYNSSGWKNPKQLTTANDMAKLARALLNEYPGYYHLFSQKEFHFGDKCIKGHYALLGRKGDIVVDGIKTGFVNASGYNLAASAVRGKKRLIAVVLGGKTSKARDNLTYFLLQKGFSNFKNDDFLAKNQEKKLVASPQPQRMESLLNEVLKTQVSEEPFPGIYNKINESTLNKGNKK